MNRAPLALFLPLLWAAPAVAQPMDMNMPGMKMPGAPASHPATATRMHKPKHGKRAGHRKGHGSAAAHPTHAAGSAMPVMNMAAKGMPGMSGQAHPGPGSATAVPRAQNPSSMAGVDTSGGGAPAAQTNRSPSSGGMAGMNRSDNAGGAMAGMSMPAASEPPIPQTPPPPAATDHAADRYYDPATMAAARREMRMEMGGMPFSKIMTNLLEYQAGPQGGGYRWDGEAWIGGDINRLVLKSEGEGSVRDGLESGEAQALYSRAVGRYTDLQVGVRQDFSPHARTYLAVGAQSLFPYWVDVNASLFLSTRGELLARAEGYYDLRLTQRLVLQPRAELNFAAQDIPGSRIGSGLSNAELGLRLRYEIRREFAPYIGVSYDQMVGKTADFARLHGEDPGGARLVAGLRAWF